MLKNALLYKEILQKKFQETWYNPAYKFYSGGTGNNNLLIPDNCYENHCFASVDSNDNVLGYIAYHVDYAAMSCCNFGAISFDLGNLVFTKDLLQSIDDIFVKYGMNRIDFWAFVDNPIVPTYQKLVEKYGGRIVGILEDTAKLMDGQLHSSIIFELKADSYLFNTRFRRRNSNV